MLYSLIFFLFYLFSVYHYFASATLCIRRERQRTSIPHQRGDALVGAGGPICHSQVRLWNLSLVPTCIAQLRCVDYVTPNTASIVACIGTLQLGVDAIGNAQFSQ
ncbi:hypothetical protein EDD16DRAFT_139748 [Pisolithus croceorrhizus]|nr:hypothetical protein EDD16DRAFT_139748 [Pisolithus croceorrhizus]